MNARIKQLVEQATRIGVKTDKLGGTEYTSVFDKEKFAESIVLKCAELMYGRDENGNCKDGDVIKKYFGVEE